MKSFLQKKRNSKIRNKKSGNLMRTNRQGLERQLVEAGDFDGWLAGATRGSYLTDIAGKGTCETTTAESPAACP